jgi:hypothetical protein
LLLLKWKSFPPHFASKRKLLNRSEAKNLKRKKANKSEQKRKKRKKAKKSKKKLEFRLAVFRFEAKITKVKRSEKIEVKFYSEQAKHM